MVETLPRTVDGEIERLVTVSGVTAKSVDWLLEPIAPVIVTVV